MQDTSRHPVGRPLSACLTAQVGSHDKWALLRDLTIAAEDFGLGHRPLSVLKALLSFWPERELPSTPGGAIVFPSNRALSERLSGMPESTLRRHLAALTARGIIHRHDSANGKRFARRAGSEIGVAFGFDLSPLARAASALERAVTEVTLRRERIAVLRARLGMLRQRLLETGAPEELLEAARLLLRRKCSEDVLSAIVSRLEAELPTQAPDDIPALTVSGSVPLSASNTQNERHIQESDRPYSDSESAQQPKVTPLETAGPAEKDTRLTVPMIAETCREYRAFFPEAPKGWHELVAISQRLAPMMGIEPPVLHEAQRIMGPERAAATLLCLLERHAQIRKPGAYLRRLTQMAQRGSFSVFSLLSALSRRPDAGNCQLTI
ncbi:replication initiator RepC (plasmid) [Alloyangia pacifica]|uniref:Replication initiator RepC n=1 Tax=Alloyangia pacifica TaxID=311180 RepID=A0A2U8HKJ6_9RHOB|nr:plasmid replication protein RepC [Alloyangia pacifica]AWI86417.1 replication initiator RepC [Alloyangia pacifica]